MRVRVEGRKLFGTPLEIVKELGKYMLYNKKVSVDQYMTEMLKRLSSNKKSLPDKTLEKRCESFLRELEKRIDLKIL